MFNEIYDTLELIFSTKRNIEHHRITAEFLSDAFDRFFIIGPDTIHFINETNSGYLVPIGLAPYCFGLRLNTCYAVKKNDRAFRRFFPEGRAGADSALQLALGTAADGHVAGNNFGVPFSREAGFVAFGLALYFYAIGFVAENPLLSTLGFFGIYVLVAGLSLPGATVMTLAAGALFGWLWGLLIVSFASSIGATLALLIARSLLRDWVQGRFAQQLLVVNEGLRRDGGFYLFSIRMVPLLPFFIVNLVMGLTRISVWQFYWVSQVGMFAATVVFVFAGTQLAQVTSIGDVLSPGMIIALSLLGLFPLIARKSLQWLKQARGLES